MARNKSKAELEAENRFLRKGDRVVSFTAIFTQLVKTGGLVAIAYMGYLSIAALSGKSTKANILVSLLGDMRSSQTLSWVLTAGSVSYGAAQAKLRKRAEKRLGDRVKELEQVIDSGRSSSRE